VRYGGYPIHIELSVDVREVSRTPRVRSKAAKFSSREDGTRGAQSHDMNRSMLMLAASLLASARLAVAREGEPNKPSAGAEWAMESRLVWRGMHLGGPTIMPSAHGTFHGVSLESAAALSTTGQHSHPTFVSGKLSYAWRAGPFELRPGVAAFASFAGQTERMPATAEAMLEGAYVFGDGRVFTAHSVDLRSALGGYFGTLGISFEHELKAWTASAFADVGWASATYDRAYFGESRAGLELVELGGAVQLDVTEWMYLGLHAEVSHLLIASLAHALGQSPTLFHGGASVGFEID